MLNITGLAAQFDRHMQSLAYIFTALLRVKIPKSECSLNVIVNVIGVFRGFFKLSHIALNPYRIRVYNSSVVRNLPPGTASS